MFSAHCPPLPPACLTACLQGIMNEVELLRALNHRNIVKCVQRQQQGRRRQNGSGGSKQQQQQQGCIVLLAALGWVQQQQHSLL